MGLFSAFLRRVGLKSVGPPKEFFTNAPSFSPELVEKLEELVKRTVYGDKPESFFATEDGRFLLDQHVWERYEQARQLVAPWAERTGGLSGRHIVEVGCGSASSTAAFARYAKRVDGYEISQDSVDLGRERLAAVGVENANLHCVSAEGLVSEIEERSSGADAILFYAVLEHMTIRERIDALEMAQRMLPPGGLLIVIETPNRLTYTDMHTSHLPFFQMLPLELAASYYDRSKRDIFVESLRGQEDAVRELVIQRWGTGVSFHEFEVVFGDNFSERIVADGFEDEMVWLYPFELEDRLLARYFEEKALPQHRAFTRNHLNFIAKQP